MRKKTISLQDKTFFEQLELQQVLDFLAGLCHCDPARQLLYRLSMSRDRQWIQLAQNQTFEMLRLMQEYSEEWRLGRYSDIQESLGDLSVPGYVIDLDDLVAFRQNLLTIHAIQKFLDEQKRKEFPLVTQEFRDLEGVDSLLTDISRVLNDQNEIRPDASLELLRIQKSIDQLKRSVSATFERLKKDYTSQNYLADSEETIINGRRVLSLPVENKRKISGIIHHYSSSGKTAFIEPQEMVVLQNDIQDHLQKRRAEIRKILLTLSDKIRPHLQESLASSRSLARIDLLAAKAKFAAIFEAHPVKITEKMGFDYRNARHPILFLHYRDLNKKVIPFSLRLRDATRMLIVSGPNAGGKTVTMKSIGVIQVLVQCGLPVPVGEESSTSIFDRIFTDIGDSQSLQNELSTYSSKIKNLQYFLQHANSKTLLLLDEFGSGTDPAIGGAIAEAILEALDHKGAYVLTTTHYANLKVLADKSKSMINGAMSFNKQTLRPDFRLLLGQPGNSYAFEISRRLGIPEKILKKAERKADSGQVKLERILQNIQNQEIALQDKLIAVESKNARLESLIQNYETLKSELEYRRKKMRLQAKELEMELRNKMDHELQEIKNQLSRKAEEQELESVLNHQKRQTNLRQQQRQIKEDLFQQEREQSGMDIRKGSHVKLRDGELAGTVERIDNGRVWIQTGILQVEANLTDVIAIREPLDPKRSKSIKLNTKRQTNSLKTRLDLRGYSVSEAQPLLETYLDRAVVEKIHSFTIIHGKGTGALRDALWQLLKNYPIPMQYTHPPDDRGGRGQTHVSFV